MGFEVDCFDQTNALNALLAVLLITGGGILMNTAAPNLGVALLFFGLLLLSLAVVDRDLSALKDPMRALGDRRSMVALGSALLMFGARTAQHYHLASLISKNGGQLTQELINKLPTIYNVLITAGMVGLVGALSMNKDGSLNAVRGAMGIAGVAAVYYAGRHMMYAQMDAPLEGGSSSKVQTANALYLASHLILVLAVSYAC